MVELKDSYRGHTGIGTIHVHAVYYCREICRAEEDAENVEDIEHTEVEHIQTGMLGYVYGASAKITNTSLTQFLDVAIKGGRSDGAEGRSWASLTQFLDTPAQACLRAAQLSRSPTHLYSTFSFVHHRHEVSDICVCH